MNAQKKIIAMTMASPCAQCGSKIEIYCGREPQLANCPQCGHEQEFNFTPNMAEGILDTCPCCQRKDFYQQKDFNRIVGVTLFIIAAILSIFTYGLSLIVLFFIDFFLFKRLGVIVCCYKCKSVFRGVSNLERYSDFDHEKHDRIVYSNHDFQGN